MDFFGYDDPEGRARQTPDAVRLRPVLRELSDADLDSLEQFAAALRYAPGSRIVSAGERNDTLLIIVSGSVRLTEGEDDRGKHSFEDLSEGEVFSISSFLDGEASAINATALESTEILALRRTSFEQLAAWKPALAIALLQDIAAYTSRRLRRLRVAC